MTDLEITLVCARMMGEEEVSIIDSTKPPVVARGIWLYDPLHNDEQAMALVKKFELEISRYAEDKRIVWSANNVAGNALHISEDLNRAICECVAKMQQHKHD